MMGDKEKKSRVVVKCECWKLGGRRKNEIKSIGNKIEEDERGIWS